MSTYDLHIHSCLSPCGSFDMTPANIAGMAYVKGLSIISLTDHNTGGNLAAMAKAAAEYNLVFIPGIEVTTVEEVHVLVYFATLEQSLPFCNAIYQTLPEIPNRPDIFGEQILMDNADHIIGALDKLLLQATPYTLEQIADMATAAGGSAVPAHINRDSFSLLNNIGYIPDGLFNAVEISPRFPKPSIDQSLKTLTSSDAHRLGDISEPDNKIPNVQAPEHLVSWLLS